MTQLADRAAAGARRVDQPLDHTVVVDRERVADGGPVRPRSLSARTADDWLALVGSAIASLCLAWLLYEVVLPLAGSVGFFACWFALFVAIHAALTAATQPGPVVVDRVVASLVVGAAALVAGAVLWTLWFTFYKGWPAYTHWSFFTHDMSGTGPAQPLSQGGITHALVGTAWELGIAVVISLPLGLATAVFLTEVGGRFARVVRTVVEAMTALPDLIAGLFVYALLIITFGAERTGLVAAIALSVTMLPIIARSSEVVLRVVPGGLREAGLALGAPRWRTVWSVVLPTARTGLATALILGMARGIGESAPLVIVARTSSIFNANPLSGLMNSLPLMAITDLRAPDQNTITRGYGAASVLLAFVVVLFVAVRLLARQRGGKR